MGISLEFFYTLCLGLGLSYAALAGGLGFLFGHGGDVQMDAGGHLDAGQPSPLSGTVIATFVTGFGAGGTLAHRVLDWSAVPGMAMATGTGLILAGGVFALLDFIFSRTQAGSEYTTDDLVGAEAEVITPIGENALGEIAYIVKGQRERLSARTLDGSAVRKGALVVIESLAGSTAYVRLRE